MSNDNPESENQQPLPSLNKLLSTMYTIGVLYLTEQLIPTISTRFFLKDVFSFSKFEIKHKFFIVKLLKLIEIRSWNLTIKTEDAATWQFNGVALCAAQISALPKSSFPFYEKLIPCISLLVSVFLYVKRQSQFKYSIYSMKQGSFLAQMPTSH